MLHIVSHGRRHRLTTRLAIGGEMFCLHHRANIPLIRTYTLLRTVLHLQHNM